MSRSDPCAKEQTNQPNQTVEQQAEGSGGRVRQRMLMDDEGEVGGNEAFSLQRPVTYGRVTYGTPAPDWPQRVPRFHDRILVISERQIKYSTSKIWIRV